MQTVTINRTNYPPQKMLNKHSANLTPVRLVAMVLYPLGHTLASMFNYALQNHEPLDIQNSDSEEDAASPTWFSVTAGFVLKHHRVSIEFLGIDLSRAFDTIHDGRAAGCYVTCVGIFRRTRQSTTPYTTRCSMR